MLLKRPAISATSFMASPHPLTLAPKSRLDYFLPRFQGLRWLRRNTLIDNPALTSMVITKASCSDYTCERLS